MLEKQNDVDVVELVRAELEKEKKNTRNTYLISVVLVIIVLGYTTWLSSQITKILHPEELALTTSGLVIDAVPKVGQDLERTLVDGAPGIARSVTDEILDTLPSFRMYLEEQFTPIVDQVAHEMTFAAVAKLKEEVKNAKFEERAPSELARALVEEFQKTIEFALDEPNAEGETPRDRIDRALATLEKIDAELKMLERGGNLPPDRAKERELIMGWLEFLVRAEAGEDVLKSK